MVKNKRQKSGGWTTAHEIMFLNKLGSHSTRDHGTPKSLLKKYIEIASRRKTWGTLDKHKIIEHAKKLLASY